MTVTNNPVHRYIDITSAVSANTTGYTTIKQIRYSVKTKIIEGSGDADKNITWMAKGMKRVSGSLTIEDPVQAAALIAGAAADFVFTGTDPVASKALTVTIKNALFFDLDGDEKHDELAGTTVTFAGYMTDGSAVFTAASA